MEHQEPNVGSFEDAIALSVRRHRETIEELRHLRQDLRERDLVISRQNAKLSKQCEVELENRKLQQKLRALEDGVARLLQQDPNLKDKLTAMTAGKAEDAAATLNGTQNVPVDAVHSLASSPRNYIARLPYEMRGDIFMNLDRHSLDRAGFACPQFNAVVGCLVAGSLRVLGRVCLAVGLKRFITVSVDYSSDPLALKNGSTKETVRRQWSFSKVDADAATSHVVGLLRHAIVIDVTLDSPSPTLLLQALSSTDMDVTVKNLAISGFALRPADLPVARSALTSFNSLHRLKLKGDIPPDFLTDDVLVNLRRIRVVHFEFGSNTSFGGLIANYDGDYPDIDAGLMTFLVRGCELDEPVVLKFPAARVQPDFCLRLLKAAISDGSRNKLKLSFMAVGGDLKVKLEGFQAYALQYPSATIIYKVPQSPDGDMLLKLEITALGDAPDAGKLVEFQRYKGRVHADPYGDDGWGGGGGDGFGGGGFGNVGFGGAADDDWA